jgi:hypothetical protein
MKERNELLKSVIEQHLFEEPKEFIENVTKDYGKGEISNFRYPECTFEFTIKDDFELKDNKFDTVYKIAITNNEVKIV